MSSRMPGELRCCRKVTTTTNKHGVPGTNSVGIKTSLFWHAPSKSWFVVLIFERQRAIVRKSSNVSKTVLELWVNGWTSGRLLSSVKQPLHQSNRWRRWIQKEGVTILTHCVRRVVPLYKNNTGTTATSHHGKSVVQVKMQATWIFTNARKYTSSSSILPRSLASRINPNNIAFCFRVGFQHLDGFLAVSKRSRAIFVVNKGRRKMDQWIERKWQNHESSKKQFLRRKICRWIFETSSCWHGLSDFIHLRIVITVFNVVPHVLVEDFDHRWQGQSSGQRMWPLLFFHKVH